jgi:molecular chaperone DnaJ
MAGQDWFEKDFYSVLGVPPDAGADKIKKAYRKLARQYHPDTNSSDPSPERRFKEIGEAYSVLGDPEQRQQYDAVRAMTRGGARFSAGGPNGGSAGFEDLLGSMFGAPGGSRTRFGPPGAASSPMFEDLLGGMFAGGQPGPQVPRPGTDLRTEVTLTFRQAVEGAMVNLRVGDPASGGRTVNARIPAGVRDGQRVRLAGKGRAGGPGLLPGDLVVTVHVESHPVFSLDGEDVRVTVPVSFPEAVLGAQIEVPTLDGGTVRLKVPPGFRPGQVLRARGRGARTSRRTGDLLVTVQIAVPQKLSSQARKALEEFAELTADDGLRAEFLRLAGVQPRQGAGDAR